MVLEVLLMVWGPFMVFGGPSVRCLRACVEALDFGFNVLSERFRAFRYTDPAQKASETLENPKP